MPNIIPQITRLPPVPMTVADLMQRSVADVQNYDSELLPLLQRWGQYKGGFIDALIGVPGNIYAVANFNLKNLEPNWRRKKFNLFDMKVSRCLLGKHWSEKPESERPHWIAVPEQATYLHYNTLWSIPEPLQERFFSEAPGIWRKVVPSGQFHLQVIGEDEVGEQKGQAAAARIYSGKTFHPRWTIDNTILSTEFREKK